MLVPCEDRSASTAWIRRHEPVSVSICSNVDREPKCFINKDQSLLVDDMMKCLGNISDEVYKLATEKWDYVFTELEEREKAFEPLPDDSDETAQQKQYSLEKLRALQGSFHHYCRQCPVLGFNSSNYDLNLVKTSLLTWLRNDKREKKQRDG